MNKDFINKKLELLKKDKQQTFADLAEPLAKMVENGEAKKVVKVPSDGNWFSVSFDAVQVKQDRLVISAERADNGMHPSGQYRVSFSGTRAAYLRAYYEPTHRKYRWPHIYWDIRAYANHPREAGTRVYIHGFKAHDEIRKMIMTMQKYHSFKNILNSYILDNLTRVQLAIKTGKKPEEIERRWSNGMMESLGYKHVELIDAGLPKGSWRDVKSHWFKVETDAVNV